MCRLRMFVVIVLCFSSQLCAQEISREKQNSLELLSRFKRISETLKYVHSENSGNSILELVSEQQHDLNQLRLEYEKIVKEYAAVTADETADTKNAIVNLSGQVSKLQDKLFNRILLPHQVEQVNGGVFLKLIEENQGNVAQVMTDIYLDEIKLNSRQFSKIFGLKKEVIEEIKKARKEYRQKVKEITSKAENEIEEVLSKKQLEKFDTYRNPER